MSASTASITANPGTRRRPVVAIDQKSPIEVVAKSPISVAQTKQTVSTSAGLATEVYTRRTRKAAPQPEKPKWVTVSSILIKNLLLLAVLIALVQFVRNSVYNNSDGFSVRKGSELETQVADMEGFVKKATKVLQDRVEVMDKKIEKGLSLVKRDLNKKIDEKNGEITSEFKRVYGSIEGLERALGNLRAEEWLKKEDFDGFIEEYRKSKGGDGSHDVDLDEVREVARGIVERELERFAADGLGRVDFAVASGGATVERHSEKYTVGRGIGVFNKVKNGVHVDAVKMISPSFGEPGQCFALKGSSGFVEIKLRTTIIPDAVTLEHVAKSVAFDRSSAPKDCRISGWLQKHDSTDQAADTEKMILLADFSYDLKKSNAQTFDVLDTPIVIDTIRLDFLSNHGNSAHTCIYRLRVHGHEPDSIPMLNAQS